ncbi:hypothetical protein RRG08_054574 [Elysia crispata]|uniref:Uncharacterized protein n=1 Tax=Elysia crispata TaxID=231223 RepID=A0AAE1B0H7_9GAST|nr:hypothetical protein RRG08_054574 [Elysia crispata]
MFLVSVMLLQTPPHANQWAKLNTYIYPMMQLPPPLTSASLLCLMTIRAQPENHTLHSDRENSLGGFTSIT